MAALELSGNGAPMGLPGQADEDSLRCSRAPIALPPAWLPARHQNRYIAC
jgi:hypothetical protein